MTTFPASFPVLSSPPRPRPILFPPSTSPFSLALDDLEELTVAEEMPGMRTLTMASTVHQHDFAGPGTPCSARSEGAAIRRPSTTPSSCFYKRSRLRLKKPPFSTFLDLFKDQDIAEHLVRCLDLRGTVALMRVANVFQSRRIRRVLKRRRRELILAGLEPYVRVKLWRWVASLSHPRSGVYSAFRSRPTKLQSSILADIARIHANFKLSDAQQKQMYAILNALSQYLPDVGYCQSLVFITAVLLKTRLSEEDCFWVLHSLLVHYDFRSVVAGKFEKLKLLCYQFDCFLYANLPAVADKMHQADFSADLYAMRWLLTLFSYELPPSYLCTLWDLFFLEKWKVMLRAGLAFVQAVDNLKLRPNGGELFCLLRSVNSDSGIAEEVLRKMYEFKVTKNLMTGLIVYYEESIPPMLELHCEDGHWWWQRQDDEPSVYSRALDETLCMEDLGSPLNAYFPQSFDECHCQHSSSPLVCSTCGSASHSSMYCDQDTEDTSIAYL